MAENNQGTTETSRSTEVIPKHALARKDEGKPLEMTWSKQKTSPKAEVQLVHSPLAGRELHPAAVMAPAAPGSRLRRHTRNLILQTCRAMNP